MPNQLLKVYRDALASQGLTDDTPDDQLTLQLGQQAEQQNRGLFDQYPDFGQEYSQLRDAAAPSLVGEAGNALVQGTRGLASTTLGGVAALTGSESLRNTARSFDEPQEGTAPTIQSLEDIAPGSSTLGKVFSKDAFRYLASKAGGAIPSLAEGAALSLGGAAIGSLAGPEGTAAGALEGAAEGLLGRGIIKTAIKKLVANGVLDSEATGAAALQSGDAAATKLILQQAKNIAARRGGEAVNAVNAYLQSTGSIYNETPDQGSALGLGALAAIPNTGLSHIVLGKIFPDLSGKALSNAGADYVKRAALEGLKTAGIGATGSTVQESANLIARNLNEGRDAFDFSDDDLKRLREAAIGGGIGGALIAPFTALGGRPAEKINRRNISVLDEGTEGVLPPKDIVDSVPPEDPTQINNEVNNVVEQQRTQKEMAEVQSVVEQQRLDQQNAEIQAVIEQQKAAKAAKSPEGELAEVVPAKTETVPAEDVTPTEATTVPDRTETGDGPAKTYQYTVQQGGIGPDGKTPYPGFVSVDEIGPNGERLGSYSPEDLRAKGIDIPQPPPWMPDGNYSEQQVRDAQANPPKETPVTLPPIPEAPTAAPSADTTAKAADPAAPEPLNLSAPLDTQAVPTPPDPNPLPAQQAVAQAFTFGKVVEGEGIPFRNLPQLQGVDPNRFVAALQQQATGNFDSSGNRSKTRGALVLEAPDGTVVKAGLIRPQIQKGLAGEDTGGQLALQRMGKKTANGKTIQAGGDSPVTVAELMRAGYKPVEYVKFDAEPGKIFQTFPNLEAYDKAYGLTEKTSGKKNQMKMSVGAGLGAELAQRSTKAKLVAVEARIDQIAEEFGRHPKGSEEHQNLMAEYSDLRTQQRALDRINQQETGNTELPAYRQGEVFRDSARTDKFQIAIARLKQMGVRVDLFAQEMLRQETGNPEAQGVSYSPYHIAIGLEDVQNANLGNLVTAFHEAAHSLIGRIGGDEKAGIPPIDEIMAKRIARSAESALADLRSKAEGASSRTGVDLSKAINAEDQLAETLAQRLAADGIDGSPNIAKALVRWVKDLYFRTMMAVQAGFGVQPSDKLALGWLENQFRRELNGDYHYGFHSFTDRFQPESTVDQVGRHQITGGTPQGISDFHDPYTQKQSQPEVSSSTLDGVRWNLKYQTHDDAPEGMSPHEAYHRIDAAATNEVQRIAQDLYNKLKVTIPFEQFWKIAGVGDLPASILQGIKESIPGTEISQIGGDGMTDTMNGRANLKAREIIQEMQRKALRKAAEKAEAVTKLSEDLVEKSQRANVMESNFRDADMHERIFRDSLKQMIRDMVSDTHDGLDLSRRAGSLDEAIREAANITESEAIPQQYQDFLERQKDGGINLFNYLRAVSDLDLDIGNMKIREIINAVREAGDDNPVLHELAQNKPAMAAIVALARDNATQLDLVQLGRLKDMEKLRAIDEDIKRIRTATDQGLKDMLALSDQRAAGRGLAQRLKIKLIAERQALRRTQEALKKATYQSDLLRQANTELQPAVDDLQKTAGSYDDWKIAEGAEYTAMQLQSDGSWVPAKRTLSFNPDGSGKNADQVAHDLVQNRQYIEQNVDKSGTTAYEAIKRRTTEMQAADFKAKYPQQWRTLLDRILQPLADEMRALGGNAGHRAATMMLRWQAGVRNNKGEIEILSRHWTHSLQEAEIALGYQDHGKFFKQIYDPVMYMLGTEPGLNEQQAIRKAIRVARARLSSQPTENFNKSIETLVRNTKAINDRLVAIAEKQGVFIEDERLGGQLRKVVSGGWLTNMRRMSDDVIGTVINDMEKAGWTNEFTEQKRPNGEPVKSVVRSTTFDGLTADQATNPDQLRQQLSPIFTPGIIGRWLEPIMNKTGEGVFTIGGRKINQLDVNHAWQAGGGDVVSFIDALAAARNIPPEALPGFRVLILQQIGGLHGMYSKIAYEAKQTRSLFDPMGPRQHVLMDARVNDLMPPEHVKFATYEPATAQANLATIAFHSAFGRNAKDMVKALNELKTQFETDRRNFGNLEGSSVKQRKLDAAANGWNYDQLKRAARNADDVVGLQQKLEHLFGFQNQSGPLGDVRAGLEALSFITGQVVNNPKTGLLNTVSLADRIAVQRSLGSSAIGATANAFYLFSHNIFGGLLENIGLHLMRSSQYAKWVGEAEGVGYGRLPRGVAVADIGKGGNFQASATDSWLIRPLRKISAFQRHGVGFGFGESREFAKPNLIPGLGGVTHYISQQAGIANAVANIQQFEHMVKRAINYFEANPEKATDPNFRLTAKDLGMNNRAFFGNEGVFDYYRNKATEYRVGNLEQIAKEAAARKASGADTLLTRDQALAIAMMSANELNLEASVNTRLGAVSSNPILKYGMPLLGWPLEKMNSIHRAMKTIDGQYDGLQMLKTVGRLAMWNLPMGMAFTLAMDRYDKDLLKKKSNVTDVDWQTAIPIAGPALALLGAGKLTPQQNIMGMLERQARAGNIYGLGGDLISQIFSPQLDPGSGQRAISLDQRVLAFSQFLNVQRAITAWMTQGQADWPSVEKPLIQSIGGNGVLHAVDLVNAALGLDNQEARMVMRTNASAWLTSAAREVGGIELAKSFGGGASPTPVSMHVRAMQLAALANDHLDFQQAYQQAVQAARDMGEEKPEAKVLEAWRSRSPLSVFRGKPTPSEMAAMLSVMAPEGQEAVRSALRQFDQFTQLIKPTDSQKRDNRVESQIRSAGRLPMALRSSATALY